MRRRCGLRINLALHGDAPSGIIAVQHITYSAECAPRRDVRPDFLSYVQGALGFRFCTCRGPVPAGLAGGFGL